MARRPPVDAEHPAYDPGACGPDGLPHCRRCLEQIRGRRDGFCSDACRHEFLMRASPAYARAAVFARDRGICTHCRLDCGLLDRVVRRLVQDGHGEEAGADDAGRGTGEALALRTIAALGFGMRRRVTSLWQADHRLAVAEGGRDCGLGNYRTLCLRCHARETRELHRRLRQRRLDP